MFLKLLMFFIIIVAANNAKAQSQQQQKNLGKILYNQKSWQQSKSPYKTIYNNNLSYKVPIYPGQQSNIVASPQNKIIANPNKINSSFTIKLPANYLLRKSDTINIQKKLLK